MVKSQFGFHIIKVVDKKPAVTRTFDEVRPQIEEQLRLVWTARGAADSATLTRQGGTLSSFLAAGRVPGEFFVAEEDDVAGHLVAGQPAAHEPHRHGLHARPPRRVNTSRPRPMMASDRPIAYAR